MFVLFYQLATNIELKCGVVSFAAAAAALPCSSNSTSCSDPPLELLYLVVHTHFMVSITNPLSYGSFDNLKADDLGQIVILSSRALGLLGHQTKAFALQ